MAWTSPMTFVAFTALTAAQLNTFVRDNFNETAPGKATTAGSMFTSSGVNVIAERRIASATVSTSQSTNSNTYTDLATVGPTVSVVTGTYAHVIVTARHKPISHTILPNGTAVSGISFAVTGASNQPASTDRQMRTWQPYATDVEIRRSMLFRLTDLTPGTNTFTMKYALLEGDVEANGANALFEERQLIVMAF